MTAKTPETRKAATIYDVARVAGVSHQTVSRVLRDAYGTSAAAKQKVQDAVEQLQYRPSVVARELASAKPSRIGVVGYETFESSTSKVLKGVNEVAVAAGYVLDIVTVDAVGDVKDIERKLDAINGSDVAGLLATSPTVNVREALERSVFRMPVFLDVNGDNDPRRSSTHTVMNHLLDLGHTRIAHVAGPAGWESAQKRELGYRSLLSERGLLEYPIARGDWSAASGYRAVGDLPLNDGITAIFVANDRMALGVIRALMERGVRIPEDISIVGTDDIPEAEFFTPPLTTVHFDFAEAGRVAARSLISLIETPEAALPDYPSATFKVRKSTAPPRSTLS